MIFVLLFFSFLSFFLYFWLGGLVTKSCPALATSWTRPMLDSSVHRILQARMLEWVVISFSRGSSWPRNRIWVSCIAGRFSTDWAMKGAPLFFLFWLTVQFSSVAQSCQTLCDPMNHSTPGLRVHHQLPEFTQTHVNWVSDAIQPSHPLSSLSPPAPNPSQHQSLFPVS